VREQVATAPRRREDAVEIEGFQDRRIVRRSREPVRLLVPRARLVRLDTIITMFDFHLLILHLPFLHVIRWNRHLRLMKTLAKANTRHGILNLVPIDEIVPTVVLYSTCSLH
jgi:hypothetical protein